MIVEVFEISARVFVGLYCYNDSKKRNNVYLQEVVLLEEGKRFCLNGEFYS